MGIISREDIAFAAGIGSLLGVSGIVLLIVWIGGSPGLFDLLGGAWMGFAFTCAIILIINSSRRNGSD